MAQCPDLAQAVVPMGMLMGWCATMHLLSDEFQSEHEQTVLRVRMQEVRGSELLVSAGGDLRSVMFNAQGNRFLERYYARYLEAYDGLFGQRYGVEESWHNYAKLARVLTENYMGKGNSGGGWRLPRWLRWRRSERRTEPSDGE